MSLLAAACTKAAPGQPVRAAGAAAGRAPARAASPSLVLQITPAPYQLPAGTSREVVLPAGGRLLIAGGLTPSSATTTAVRTLDPVTGRTLRAGRLRVPAHDAAGAVLGGHAYLFGGGSQQSVAVVQSLPGRGEAPVAGQLPRPRSDLAAVTIGGTHRKS